MTRHGLVRIKSDSVNVNHSSNELTLTPPDSSGTYLTIKIPHIRLRQRVESDENECD